MVKKGYKPTEEHKKYLKENHSRYWLGKKRPNLWNGCRIELKGKSLEEIHGVEKAKEIIKKKSNSVKKSMQNIVHHINGNHYDDREENKKNMSQSEHIKIHIKQDDVHPWTNRW